MRSSGKTSWNRVFFQEVSVNDSRFLPPLLLSSPSFSRPAKRFLDMGWTKDGEDAYRLAMFVKPGIEERIGRTKQRFPAHRAIPLTVPSFLSSRLSAADELSCD